MGPKEAATRLGFVAILVAAFPTGCGSEPDARVDAGLPPPAPSLGDVPGPAQAYAMPVGELESLYALTDRRAAEGESTEDGVRWARAAARIARVIALRREDDEWLGRAREHLETASRRRALDGACEAALELARLEAADAGDPAGAYAVAYRTERRFAGARTTHGECLAEARRITQILEPYRPGPERLAAIEADPDADDPSVSLAAAEGDLSVAEWAEGRSDLGDAQLTRIDVYGAPQQEEQGGVVRVVLQFEGVAVFERGELPREGVVPRRAYLDLKNTTLGEGVPRTVRVGGAGLERVRAAPFEPGVTRVVFDLQEGARYRLFFLPDPYRVLIDFERAGATAQPVVQPGEARTVRTIVIDPGHGGNEYGARHGGLKESELTLDISRRIATILERRLPDARILLTRHRDEVISLERRVAFANAVDADAFVSIHLNAADDPVEHGGVATFVLDTTNDRQAIRLAARENGTSTQEVSGLQRILAGLHREEQLTESRSLAELVQIGTLAGGRRVLPQLPDRGVKSAMFYVLVGARMPAVLLEASFLTQPEENRALATERYRQVLAEGAAEGIVRWARGG